MKIYHRLTGETLFDSVHETIKETVEAVIATDADLSDADLSDADLSDADLSRANLSGANLSWADLSDADLSRANLIRADLSRANLSRANLIRADLSDANLSRASLIRANLSDADLSRADLSRANLIRANLSRANLIRADLSDADLSDADLSDANLPTIDRFENLRGAICARVCATPENLEMNAWHTCKTTHCLAGWATVIHPQGRLLESIYGTSVAAAMIFQVCEGEVPDFHSSNEDAMEWLKSGKTDVLVSE